MNLIEFPIALLGDQAPAGVKTLTFKDKVRNGTSGDPIERILTITASDLYGLPTSLDDDVVIGLIQVSKSFNNFADPSVRFLRGDLIEVMGWPADGRRYKRLNESLNRWTGVTLYYRQGWWNKKRRTWESHAFHVIDKLHIVEKRGPRSGDVESYSSFRWGDQVFESLKAEYIGTIDIGTYFALQPGAGRRIFRWLTKRFHKRDGVDVKLQILAFEKVGMSRTLPPNKIKKVLGPALDELVQFGIIDPMPAHKRYWINDEGEWMITFHKPPSAHPKDDVPTKPEDSHLVAALVAHGVVEHVARELVFCTPERVQPQIDHLEWIMRQPKCGIRNPGAYLVNAVRENLPPPQGFTRKVERSRELDRKIHEDRMRKDAERRIQDRIAEARSKMTNGELADLERRLEEAATEEQRRTLAVPRVRNLMLRSMVDEHIREQMLATEGSEL